MQGSRSHKWLSTAALASALLVASDLASADASADGSCTTLANVTSKVWKHAGPGVKKALTSSGPFGATTANTIKLIEEGIKIWNTISGDKSWAKIGPRRMDFDEWNTGTLIGPTERMFVSAMPAVNPVTVDVHKLDNKGKVKFVICKVPEKGKAQAVSSFTVDSDTKVGKVKSIEIPDAKGHVISVVLHGKSVAKSLKYKVRAQFQYDDSKVKEPDHVVTAPRTGDDTKSAPRTPSKSAPRSPSTSKSAPRR